MGLCEVRRDAGMDQETLSCVKADAHEAIGLLGAKHETFDF